MARSVAKAVPNHYQILQVHPDAPPDLITAVYWRLVSQAQSAGTTSKAAEVAIYHLTRVYQVLADPKQRADYDRSLGIYHEAPSMPPLPLRRSSSWVATLWPARPEDGLSGADLDYYELLRLDSQANPGVVAECRAVMRNHYMRLVEQGYVRAELIELFEGAHRVISDASKRRSYDRERRRRLKAGQAAPAQVSAGEEAVQQAVNGKKRTAARGAAGRSRARTATASNGAASRAAKRREVAGNGKDVHVETFEAGEESATIKMVRSLAVNSAAALRMGGKGSVTLAKKASQTLRDVLIDAEGAPAGGGLTLDEERALADRLSAAPRVPLPEAMEASGKNEKERREALARLTLIEGPGRGTTFEIAAVPFTLGEAESCDVALPGIASRQASILHHNGHFVLYSLTDAPKTVMHGEPVLWAVLHGEDTFEMGPYQLRFEPASPGTPAP